MAVDVATNLMQKKGITAKFTLEELRDNITQYKCGCRGQSRKFNELDKTGWNGKTKSLKVPVIHLSAFSPDIRTALIKCKLILKLYAYVRNTYISCTYICFMLWFRWQVHNSKIV